MNLKPVPGPLLQLQYFKSIPFEADNIKKSDRCCYNQSLGSGLYLEFASLKRCQLPIAYCQLPHPALAGATCYAIYPINYQRMRIN